MPAIRAPTHAAIRHAVTDGVRPRRAGNERMRDARTRRRKRSDVVTRNLEKRTGTAPASQDHAITGPTTIAPPGQNPGGGYVSFLEGGCRGSRTRSPGTRQPRAAPERSRRRGQQRARRCSMRQVVRAPYRRRRLGTKDMTACVQIHHHSNRATLRPAHHVRPVWVSAVATTDATQARASPAAAVAPVHSAWWHSPILRARLAVPSRGTSGHRPVKTRAGWRKAQSSLRRGVERPLPPPRFGFASKTTRRDSRCPPARIPRDSLPWSPTARPAQHISYTTICRWIGRGGNPTSPYSL